MKKKLLLTALVAVMAFTLCGCSSQSENDSNETTNIDNGQKIDTSNINYDYKLDTNASYQGVSLMVDKNWIINSPQSYNYYVKPDDQNTHFSIQTVKYGQTKTLNEAWSEFTTGSKEPETISEWSEDGIDYQIGIVDDNKNDEFAYWLLSGFDSSNDKGFLLWLTPNSDYWNKEQSEKLFYDVVDTVSYDSSKTTIDYKEEFKKQNEDKDESNKTDNNPGSSKDNPVKFTYDWYKGNSLNREGKWTVAPCMITNSFQDSGERYLVATLANDDATLSDIEILVPPSEDGITDDIEVGDVIVLLGTTDEMMKVSIGNNDLGFIPTINPVEIEVAP